MTKFDKSHWAQKDFSNQYLEEADVYVLERRKLLELLKSFYKHFLADKKDNKVLDLGSGDGFAEALSKFGLLYADQTEKDWEALRRSRKLGKTV